MGQQFFDVVLASGQVQSGFDWLALIQATATLILAAVAVGVPWWERKHRQKELQQRAHQKQKKVQSAVQIEVGSLKHLFDEFAQFWREELPMDMDVDWDPEDSSYRPKPHVGTRYSKHMAKISLIDIPPVMASPQIWVQSVDEDYRKSISRLISDIMLYNQFVIEEYSVNSEASKARNRNRVRQKVDDIERDLEELGFPPYGRRESKDTLGPEEMLSRFKELINP